ncbi:phenylacetaldoxime dehydratase family protein [Burkholderia sp. 3C]
MLRSTRNSWNPGEAVANVLEETPAEAIGPEERITPLRKPAGFTPPVKRYSIQVPVDEDGFHLAMFGAQASSVHDLNDHALHDWAKAHLYDHPFGPSCVQHGRSHQIFGTHTHAICAYWVSRERFEAWAADPAVEAWWTSPDRLQGKHGTWREIMYVPRDRQESVYWLDYPVSLSASPDVNVYPTPYNSYFGSMRDRIQAAAHDLLEPIPGKEELALQEGRRGFGEHWSVQVPHNLSVIRGGVCWGLMDEEQIENYEVAMRGPVTRGMYYLQGNPLESGCASMLWERMTDADGNELPDEHAHGYFISLKHLEAWSEGHVTHAAIFRGAVATYKKYGTNQQYRSWHESYVLPEGGHRFEYFNCHPDTGLLSWCDATRIK